MKNSWNAFTDYTQRVLRTVTFLKILFIIMLIILFLDLCVYLH